MVWNKIESFIDEKLPECIKIILSLCGYNTMSSFRKINLESVTQIERAVNTHFQQQIRELKCCHSTYYINQTDFEFLPGHRDLILSLPEYLPPIEKFTLEDFTQKTEFSPILSSMIETAQQNANRDVNKYDDVVRLFSTYTFLLSGRSAYEFLNQNLPLPSTRTISE